MINSYTDLENDLCFLSSDLYIARAGGEWCPGNQTNVLGTFESI